MTPDEAAKAEAESIATRWVPAHMTARQGMVDDITAALVTGRRLVEEAQAETKAIKSRLDALGADLGEAIDERDRLKGELAEARQILADWPDSPCARLGMVPSGSPVAPCGRCLSCRRHAFLAATPAEQAQPTGGDLDICARPKCKSPRHYNIHDPERGGHVFVEAAEQAQGEGAPLPVEPILDLMAALKAALAKRAAPPPLRARRAGRGTP